MAFFNVSNQLIQIDTGKVRTYLYNKSLSSISVYSDLGETQVLGQRYIGMGTGTVTVSNPFGAPGIYMLVKYSSTANPAPTTAPAPVYWTDNTYTTVTGVNSESFGGSLNFIAGYLMLNTTDLTTLTNTQLNGALCFIQVAGRLIGGVVPGATAIGDAIIGASGNFTAGRIAANSALTNRTFGFAETAIVSGTANILLNCDII
jgi:hypothetical protein